MATEKYITSYQLEQKDKINTRAIVFPTRTIITLSVYVKINENNNQTIKGNTTHLHTQHSYNSESTRSSKASFYPDAER